MLILGTYPGDNSTLSPLPILMLPLGFLLCFLLQLPSLSVLSPLSLWVRRLSLGLVPQKNRSFSFVPTTVKPSPQKIIYRKEQLIQSALSCSTVSTESTESGVQRYCTLRDKLHHTSEILLLYSCNAAKSRFFSVPTTHIKNSQCESSSTVLHAQFSRQLVSLLNCTASCDKKIAQ